MSGDNFHESEHVKGRKDYRCEWCFKPIAKGEVHSKNAGVVDREFYSYRLHIACEAPVREACIDGDGAFCPGDGAGFNSEAFVNKWKS